MIILKFGGTSVSTKERIKTICDIVMENRENDPVLVVSAIRGVTDLLLLLMDQSEQKQKASLKKLKRLHHELAISCFGFAPEEIKESVDQSIGIIEKLLRRKKIIPALQDAIVSHGEILSSCIISFALRESGIQSNQVLATSLIVTDDIFGNAEFLPLETRRNVIRILSPLLKKKIVPVVTGFIGATKNGKITTLGRGGSDYSAAILGFAGKASEIQIWTDVDGIYTSDPRSIPTATRLPEVTYREASELAAFGAKVLHPRTIRPAIAAGIPVRILNTLHPGSKGTRIVGANGKKIHRILAITSQKNVKLITLYATEMLLSKGFLVRIFSVFAKHNISVDLVSVSEVSVSVTLDNKENLQGALAELSKFTSVSTRDAGIVSLIGEGIVEVPHVLKRIFSILDIAKNPTHMISLGASDINISIVVNSEVVPTVVRLLHDSILQNNNYDKEHERNYL